MMVSILNWLDFMLLSKENSALNYFKPGAQQAAFFYMITWRYKDSENLTCGFILERSN